MGILIFAATAFVLACSLVALLAFGREQSSDILADTGDYSDLDLPDILDAYEGWLGDPNAVPGDVVRAVGEVWRRREKSW